MKEKNTNKGITLIALVITIIVMLILVAVTISMAVNGGLFEYASNAGTKTNAVVEKEQTLASGKVEIDGKWYNNIDDYLNNKPLVILPEGIKVGDYVNYTPTAGTYKVVGGSNGSGYGTSEECQTFETEVDDETTTDVNEALQWRILSIDEETGEIELVAATQTSTGLYLKYENGYNHAVDILNDLCEALYSNENGTTARSINVEDINKKTTYDPKKDTNYSSSYDTEIRYSKRFTNTSYRKYPKLYELEDGFFIGGVKQDGQIAGSVGLKDGVIDASGITSYSTVTGYIDDWDASTNSMKKDVSVTNTHYRYSPEDYLDTNLGINTMPADLLKTGTAYWLASRYTDKLDTHATFGVRFVATTGYVTSKPLTDSMGDSGSTASYAVRPVITLGSDVKWTPAKEKINNTTTWDVKL